MLKCCNSIRSTMQLNMDTTPWAYSSSWETLASIYIYNSRISKYVRMALEYCIVATAYQYRINCMVETTSVYTQSCTTDPQDVGINISYGTNTNEWAIDFQVSGSTVYSYNYNGTQYPYAFGDSVGLSILRRHNGIYTEVYGTNLNFDTTWNSSSDSYGWDSSSELNDWNGDTSTIVLGSSKLTPPTFTSSALRSYTIYRSFPPLQRANVDISINLKNETILYYDAYIDDIHDTAPLYRIYSSPPNLWPTTKVSQISGLSFPQLLSYFYDYAYKQFTSICKNGYNYFYILSNPGFSPYYDSNIYYLITSTFSYVIASDTGLDALSCYVFNYDNKGIIGMITINSSQDAKLYISLNGISFTLVSTIVSGADPYSKTSAIMIDGIIYVYIWKYIVGTGVYTLYVETSTDGGNTWTEAAVT